MWDEKQGPARVTFGPCPLMRGEAGNSGQTQEGT